MNGQPDEFEYRVEWERPAFHIGSRRQRKGDRRRAPSVAFCPARSHSWVSLARARPSSALERRDPSRDKGGKARGEVPTFFFERKGARFSTSCSLDHTLCVSLITRGKS